MPNTREDARAMKTTNRKFDRVVITAIKILDDGNDGLRSRKLPFKDSGKYPRNDKG